jgi:hypothetical protein
VLLSVMLGMRESKEDWLALGRDLIARGLRRRTSFFVVSGLEGTYAVALDGPSHLQQLGDATRGSRRRSLLAICGSDGGFT